MLKPLGTPKVLAVNSAVAEPHTRVVVDEYEQSGGTYKLKRVATDLLRYLRKQVGSCTEKVTGMTRVEKWQQTCWVTCTGKDMPKLAHNSAHMPPAHAELVCPPFATQDVRVALVPDLSTASTSTAATGVTKRIRQVRCFPARHEALRIAVRVSMMRACAGLVLGLPCIRMRSCDTSHFTSPTQHSVTPWSSCVQSTNEVLMVAPTAFGFNEQAAQVGGAAGILFLCPVDCR